MITNDKYRLKIRAASEMFRKRPAGDFAADAVEHVIEFGSDHLRPQEAHSMSIIEFLMLDIVVVTFTIILCAFIILSVIIAKVFKHFVRL